MPEPKVGDKAPDFSLKSTSGETVGLSQFKGKKNVLLAFFPVDKNGVIRWKHVEAELGHSRSDAELLGQIEKATATI